jgi:hypothetical protein
MRLRIATKLTLVVIPLVLIPLGGLAYLWYSNTKAALERQVREELRVRLHQVGLRLRPFLRERELDVYDLASSPTLRDYHTQLEYRLVQEAEVALTKLGEHIAQFPSAGKRRCPARGTSTRTGRSSSAGAAEAPSAPA